MILFRVKCSWLVCSVTPVIKWMNTGIKIAYRAQVTGYIMSIIKLRQGHRNIHDYNSLQPFLLSSFFLSMYLNNDVIIVGIFLHTKHPEVYKWWQSIIFTNLYTVTHTVDRPCFSLFLDQYKVVKAHHIISNYTWHGI